MVHRKEEMINIHFSLDEKFLNGFIENQEKYCTSENRYFVLSDIPLKHVSKKVAILPRSVDSMKAILIKHQSAKKVVFHGLNQTFVDFIIQTNIKNKPSFTWLFFGNEVFDLNRFKSTFLLPETSNIVNEIDRIKWSLNPILLRRNLINYRANKKAKKQKDITFETAIQRINEIAHFIKEDIELFVYPLNPKIKWIEWNYFGIDQSFHSKSQTAGSEKFILIGNSASAYNNHLEAFRKCTELPKEYHVKVPLSYGEKPTYINKIVSCGNQLLNGKFEPITDFINPENYYGMLTQASAGVFFNLRSQAAGNILALLLADIPVFMQKESTLFQMFNRNQIHVFNNNSDLEKYLKNPSDGFFKEKIKGNQFALDNYFGANAMKLKYQNLLDE